jgi:multiple sugar transport system substrate-binding protein
VTSRRVPRLTRWLRLALAGVVLLAGCGGEQKGPEDASLRGRTITVWNNEYQPDRMAATRAILADFTRRTGIRTKLVAVPEDGLTDLVADAAPGELADVMLSVSLAQAHAFAAQGRSDPKAAQAVVERLGVDTFSQRALALVSRNGNAVGVPSDGWGQLLIYRRDLFERAGLDAPETLADVALAARTLDRPGMAGIALATASGDGFTAETFEHVALAFGCQLVDHVGTVLIDERECVDALTWYGDVARNDGLPGKQDVDSTREAYFEGRAAMVFWSPFLLDGLAGLRDDALPTCPECERDPAFLARNSGLVGPLAAEAGGEPSQFGSISTTVITADADTRAAQKLAEFMMTEGYVRWLALSPQGKYPVRMGPEPGSRVYVEAWKGLESGVERRAPLSDFFSDASLASLGEGVERFDRWGFGLGYGALVGALSAEQPTARAVAQVTAGEDPIRVARRTRAAVERIQDELE